MSATSTTPTPPRGTPAIDGQAGYDADQDARIRALRHLAFTAVALATLAIGAAVAPHLRPSRPQPAPVVHVAPPVCPAATCAPTLTCAACPACPAVPRSHRRD